MSGERRRFRVPGERQPGRAAGADPAPRYALSASEGRPTGTGVLSWPADGDLVWRPPRGRYRVHRHEQLSVLGAALARWTDRANATGMAVARHAGGTAVGAIDAMLYLLRGPVTHEIRQAGDTPR